MINKKTILTIVLCLYAIWASAQKKLFIKPFIGGQVPYAHYDRSIGKADTFKPRYFDITDNFGLLLQLKLNEDWSVATGWSKGNIGWNYKISIPDNLTQNPYHAPRYDHSTSNYIHRFPVQILRTLKDIAYVPIDQQRELYLFNFKLHILGGASLDYIDYKSRFDDYEASWGFPYGDLITTKQENIIKNRWSASVMAGIGMQFYRLGKERFELNLHYSQGLRNMIQSDITYTMNTETDNTRMLTRGAFIGTTLAYPIWLKTFKAKDSLEE